MLVNIIYALALPTDPTPPFCYFLIGIMSLLPAAHRGQNARPFVGAARQPGSGGFVIKQETATEPVYCLTSGLLA